MQIKIIKGKYWKKSFQFNINSDLEERVNAWLIENHNKIIVKDIKPIGNNKMLIVWVSINEVI